MIDWDIEQVYKRRARKDREQGGIVHDNLPWGGQWFNLPLYPILTAPITQPRKGKHLEKKITYLCGGRELRLTNTFTYNLQGEQKVKTVAGIKLMYLPARF